MCWNRAAFGLPQDDSRNKFLLYLREWNRIELHRQVRNGAVSIARAVAANRRPAFAKVEPDFSKSCPAIGKSRPAFKKSGLVF